MPSIRTDSGHSSFCSDFAHSFWFADYWCTAMIREVGINPWQSEPVACSLQTMQNLLM